MFTRIRKNSKKIRTAFTLVELIVVLVILAVIAAGLVPALIGYIKRSREAKSYAMAESYRVAMQAVASEYYAVNGTSVKGTTDGTKTPNLRWDSNPKVNNTEEDRKWGNKILELVGADRDNEPYIMVFGVAQENTQGIDTNQVVYVGYLADDKSPALFYVNGKWSNEYPRDSGDVVKENNTNYLVTPDNKKVKIQFFVVSNKTDTKNDIWITDVGGENTAKDTTDIDSFLEELPSNVNCNHNLSFEGLFI